MGLGGLSTKQLGTSVGQALRFCVLLPRSRLISFLQPTPAVGDCMKNVVLRTPALYCIVWKSRPPSLQVCGHAQTFGTSLWPVLSPVRFTSQAKKKSVILSLYMIKIISNRKTTKMRYCEYSYGVNCVFSFQLCFVMHPLL